MIHAGPAFTLLGWDTLPCNLRVSGLPDLVFELMFDSMTRLRVRRKEGVDQEYGVSACGRSTGRLV